MSHLSIGGLFGMKFEHLWYWFDFENSTNGFSKLLMVHFIVHSYECQVQTFKITSFLSLTKLSRSIQPIIVDEVLYQLVSRILCIEFGNTFFIHLSPNHQSTLWLRGLWNHDAWYSNNLKYTFWMGYVANKHCKCLQHNLL